MRGRTKILLFVISVILLIAAGFAYKAWDARGVVTRELAQADSVLERASRRVFERGPLEPWPGSVPEHERIADARALYRGPETAALDLVNTLDEDLAENEAGAGALWEALHEPPEAHEGAPVGFVDSARRLVRDNPQVLRLLERARHTSEVRASPALIFGIDGDDAERIEAQTALRTVLDMAMEVAQREGKVDDVLSLAGLRILMSHDLALGDGLMAFIVRGLETQKACAHVRRAMREFLPSEAALVELRRTVEIATHVPWDGPAMWTIEEAKLRHTIAMTFLEEGSMDGKSPTVQHMFLPELMAAHWLRQLDEATKIAGPLDDSLESWRALDAAVKELKEHKRHLPLMFLATLPQTMKAHLRGQQDLTLLRAATAVALHRRRTGNWPATLAMVGAEKLVCPVSGKPLRYERARVWSLGPDGDDDERSGISRLADREDWPDVNGDVVWNLMHAK